MAELEAPHGGGPITTFTDIRTPEPAQLSLRRSRADSLQQPTASDTYGLLPSPGVPILSDDSNDNNPVSPVRYADLEVSILLVDDNPDDISIMRRLLAQYPQMHFKVHSAGSLVSGLEVLATEGADIMMLDYSLPSEDGLSFLRRANALINLPPIILVTGQNDYHLAAEAIRNGASDCIYKHGMTSHGLGQSIQKALAKFRHDLSLSQYDENVIQALAETASRVDPTTGGVRLAHLATMLGVGLHLTEHEIDVLRYGAILHDIGKLGIRNELILKPSSLTDAEFMEVRLHPLIGERICAPLRLSREVGPIIRHHHERWDGAGYVDGLAGPAIPLLARVISVADAFEAMTANRPYRAALSEAVALRRLRAGAGSQWDPEIISVFLDQAARGLHRTGFDSIGEAA